MDPFLANQDFAQRVFAPHATAYLDTQQRGSLAPLPPHPPRPAPAEARRPRKPGDAQSVSER
jgi:hypothetical protein